MDRPPPQEVTVSVEARGELPDAGPLDEDPFWRTDEARARQEAQRAGKGLFVAFYADWCDRCRALDRHALEDPIFRFRVQQRFVPLRVDVTEPSTAEREQLERYGVDRLPAVLFVGADGRLARRFDEVVPLRQLLAELPRP